MQMTSSVGTKGKGQLSDIGIDLVQSFLVLLATTLTIHRLTFPLVAVLAIISFNAIAGRYLFLIASNALYSRSIVQTLSIGLALGTAIPALISGLARLTLFPTINGQLIFPILVGVISVFSQIVTKARSPQVEVLQHTGSDFVGGITIFLATIVLLFAWSWILILPLLASLPIVLHIMRRNGAVTLRVTVLTVGLILIASRVAVAISGGHWPFEYWIGLDILWDEAWIQKPDLAILGDPLNAGHSHKIYFLANLWANDLSKLINHPTFLVSGVVGIVTGVVLLIATVYSLTRQLARNTWQAVLAVGLLVVQAAFPDDLLINEALRVPNFLALGWMVASISLLFTSPALLRIGEKLAFLVLGIAVVLGKTPYAFLILGVVCGCVLTSGQARDWSSFRRYLSFGTLLLSIVAIFTLLVSSREGHSLSALGVSVTPQKILMTATLFFLRFLGPRTSNGEESTIRQFRIACNFAVGLLIVGYLLIDSAGMFLFVSAGLAINAVAASFDLPRSRTSRSRRDVFVFLILPIAGFVTAVLYWVLNIHSARSAGFVHKMIDGNGLYWYWSLVALLVLVSMSLGIGTNRLSRTLISTVVLFNAGLYFGHGFQQLITREVYGVGLDYFVSRDSAKTSVAEFVRDNSAKTDVIASNQLCWSEDLRINGPTPSRSPCPGNNVNSWVPALTQRQGFIEAPLWSSVGLTLDPTEFSKYQTVFNFTNGAFDLSLSALRASKVKYFILDIENLSNAKNWESCANIVFRSDRYLVVDLTWGSVSTFCERKV